MEIRFAEPRDVPGILSLLRQVGQVHHEGRPDLFRKGAQKFSASQVLAMLNVSQTPIFTAVEDGEVVGYGFCELRTYQQDPLFYDRKELYIEDLCVDENHRGTHIGSAIYDTICRFAQEQGCYSVTLNVWSCNPGAVKFYEAMGLVPQKVTMERVLNVK